MMTCSSTLLVVLAIVGTLGGGARSQGLTYSFNNYFWQSINMCQNIYDQNYPHLLYDSCNGGVCRRAQGSKVADGLGVMSTITDFKNTSMVREIYTFVLPLWLLTPYI